MELAAAIFTTMFGTTAAAGTAATATAATSTAAWLAGTTVTTAAGVTTSLAPAATSAALGTLQTAFSVASAASSIISGIAGMQQANSQARFNEINARQAILDAEQRSLRIRRELLEKTAQTQVAFAGSGLDISSGGAIEGALKSEADYEISLLESTGEINAATVRNQAEGNRVRGQVALVRGVVGSAGTAGRTATSIARRG